MSVKVQAHLNLIFIWNFWNFPLYMKNLRVNLFQRVFPGPVQVVSSQIASEIPVNDSIDIDHWNDMKIVVIE